MSVLDGGLDGWVTGGGELFRDVNAPSKAFGELVEATAGTPAIAATELGALLSGGADVVVVDARRFEEYRTMSIPTATSVPGAELVMRAGALAPGPATVVVVNCTGRTRSIIGTQSLINAGLPNRVMALRNGTIGWSLAGLDLDHLAGADRGRVGPRSRPPAGRGPGLTSGADTDRRRTSVRRPLATSHPAGSPPPGGKPAVSPGRTCAQNGLVWTCS